MKAPLSWLKEYLDIDLPPQKIADALVLGGLEVEKIDIPSQSFQGVVVGKVLSASPHPDADKLKVALVSDGKEEFQIICGAGNCRQGLKTAFAKIGAVLIDRAGKSHTIKKSKLRGLESYGMLCSAEELGLEPESDGILELPDHLKEGSDLAERYADPVFDISLTPNLGHCLSILGISRELAALLNLKFSRNNREFALKENPASSIHDIIHVEIQDRAQCFRYACRAVTNVTVGPSPEWMKQRLEACGIRSINNVVDVGNYVMLEMGQPLHLFDYDKIEGKHIQIASSHSFSSLYTLDEKEREIPPGVLMICDQKKPLAFAGVMGGMSSSVSDQTQNVLIESAFFTPQAIRKACKLLNLRSESSQRFERGIDPLAVTKALDRAAFLLQEIAGGKIVKGMIDCTAHAFQPVMISLRTSRVNKLLGTHLSDREIVELLERLEIQASPLGEGSLQAKIPSYRNDLLIEVDLIEEIARVYGYNNIPQKPAKHISSRFLNAPIFDFENEVRHLLMNEGLQEFMTCDLISPALAELTLEKGASESPLIHVLHPSSIDQSVLRPSLFPGLLQSLKFNTDHQNQNIHVFEVGRIHFRYQGHVKEFSTAGILLSGKRSPYHWNPKPRDCDFFDLKGIIQNLLDAVKIADFDFEHSHLHYLHPFRQARIKVGNRVLGVLGEVHPHHTAALEISRPVLFAELSLHDLLELKPKHWTATEFPPYPGSERDWTLTVKENASVAQFFSVVERLKAPLLEKMILLDLYQSPQIGSDRKNVTFRFFYRDKEKTISIEQVEQAHIQVTNAILKELSNVLV